VFAMSLSFKSLLIVVVAYVLSGCIQTNTQIQLKNDGSGAIQHTVLMSADVSGMMSGLGMQSKKAPTDNTKLSPEDSTQIRKFAATLGEGVQFVSAKRINQENKTGYVANYSFKDISKIKISQSPSAGEKTEKKDTNLEADQIQFKFIRGKTESELIIVTPEAQKFNEEMKTTAKNSDPKKEQKKSEPKAEAPQDTLGNIDSEDPNLNMQMAMLKQIFADMSVKVELVIEGEILTSNATHRAGNSFTLLDFSFGALINESDKFEQFAKSNPQSVEEAKDIMKDIPGIKLELNPETRIKFK
jgi:hypothetical protein